MIPPIIIIHELLSVFYGQKSVQIATDKSIIIYLEALDYDAYAGWYPLIEAYWNQYWIFAKLDWLFKVAQMSDLLLQLFSHDNDMTDYFKT